MFLVILLLFL